MTVKPTDFCFVDQCVLTDGVRVGFLYRETPEAGPDPDSGWSIRGEIGEASAAELDQRSIAWVQVSDVLAVDASWRVLMNAAPGSAFARDPLTDVFEPVESPADDQGT